MFWCSLGRTSDTTWRKFMHKFDRIAFDRQAGVVELGKAKLTIYAKATGRNPLKIANILN